MNESISQFDNVEITDSSAARWLFTEQGSFDGTWLVVAVSDQGLVISNGGRLLCIPESGVRRTAAYSIQGIIDHLERESGYGKRQTEGQRGQI